MEEITVEQYESLNNADVLRGVLNGLNDRMTELERTALLRLFSASNRIGQHDFSDFDGNGDVMVFVDAEENCLFWSSLGDFDVMPLQELQKAMGN